MPDFFDLSSVPVFTAGVIFLTVIASLLGFSNPGFLEKNLFSVEAILKKKEFHRLLTSQFLHANMAHLFFNMFSFYSFGAMIENRFGPKLVAVIYLYSALAGDAVALMIKRKNPGYRALGASGAVCGVIFASIFLLPGGSIMIFPVPLPIPSWIYAVFFMAISLYGIGRGSSMIGHEAHIGGALMGILWAVLYSPSILASDPLLLAGLTIPVVVLLAYFIRRK